jgi:spore coat polysaccharide biosynthesis predicted glycosyltransferase SpsG/CMP-N-acetylneuraminic acid synthetase
VIDTLTIVIPAPLHAPGLQRYLLRSLGGRPLLRRATTLAAKVTTDASRVLVVTDDEEVALLAERSGCRTLVAPTLAAALFESARTSRASVRGALATSNGLAESAVVLLRPNAPFLTLEDLADAVALTSRDGKPVHALSSATQRLDASGLNQRGDAGSPELFAAFGSEADRRITDVDPHCIIVPTQRSLQIRSQQDWWVAERLLQRRRVVFVVLGYPAVGLGHVYRASLIAHEMLDHEVVFLCPHGSDLAAQRLATESFAVHRQNTPDLAECVLRLAPDLVINDILNTDRAYVERLKQAGAHVVNFEDVGVGAASADLVVNDVFTEPSSAPNHLSGPEYFCIRDEFLQGATSTHRDQPREVLITFGGTDPTNQTMRIGRLVLQHAPENIRVSFVVGPGYGHVTSLERLLADLRPGRAELANGTKRMSEYMARADIAFSSAGRTVFELAAMRVPSIILAQHEREETHTFASRANGFVYLGRTDLVGDEQIVDAFRTLMRSADERRWLRDRMSQWDFHHGRHRVMSAISALLLREGEHRGVEHPAR